jgi:hypothetical protein
MTQARTLGELKKSGVKAVPVKEGMRRNLIRKLESGETLFPGILGYDESVVPQVANAVLSRHNMILLGLRGQAKSRLLRSLTTLLDPALPIIAGCEIHDDPLRPLCRRCRDLVKERGDEPPLGWLSPTIAVEKLATPDATIADIIGDVDPIRAARAARPGQRADHALRPAAAREPRHLLPQRAARPGRRIQVGLFKSSRRHVQIKATRSACPWTSAWSSPPIPRTTPRAARSSRP